MAKILLDYAVSFNQVESLPAPSLGFLHNIAVVVPKDIPALPNITLDNPTTTPDLIITFSADTYPVGTSISASWTQDENDVVTTVVTTTILTADELAGKLFTALDADGMDALGNVFEGVLTLATPVTSVVNIYFFVVENSSTAEVVEVTDPTQLALETIYASEIQGVFDGGLNKVTLIKVDELSQLPDVIAEQENEYFTLFCHPIFDLQDFDLASLSWEGVKGGVTVDTEAELQNTGKFSVFLHNVGVANAYNPLRAFGELLSAAIWRNQQYSATPQSAGVVTTLGQAESLFDDRFSFWLSDDDYGNRLGFFVAGGKSITTPYIAKELETLLQADTTNYLTVAQPFNIALNRAQLEMIGGKRITQFIDLGYLDGDGVNDYSVTDSNETYVVNGTLATTESVALWRVRVDAYQLNG
jgi:hypothetical protein